MKFAQSILLISLLFTVLCENKKIFNSCSAFKYFWQFFLGTSVKSSENEKGEGQQIEPQICETNTTKIKVSIP